MTANSPSSSLFTRLSAHGNSRSAMVIAGLWGLAEATVFFLIPDIYLGFVVLFRWRRGLMATAFTVIGAMLGGVVMYALAANNPVTMIEFLARIPLIDASLVDSVGVQLRAAGLIALITGPLQGIPYKVYAVQAGAQGLPLIPFILLTIPARLERILPVTLAGAFCGVLFKKYIQRHTKLVIGIYAAFWLVIYMFYFWQFR